MSDNVWDLLPALWPTSKGYVIDCAVHWVMLYRSFKLHSVQHVIAVMLDVLCDRYGDGDFVGGKLP